MSQDISDSTQSIPPYPTFLSSWSLMVTIFLWCHWRATLSPCRGVHGEASPDQGAERREGHGTRGENGNLVASLVLRMESLPSNVKIATLKHPKNLRSAIGSWDLFIFRLISPKSSHKMLKVRRIQNAWCNFPTTCSHLERVNRAMPRPWQNMPRRRAKLPWNWPTRPIAKSPAAWTRPVALWV